MSYELEMNDEGSVVVRRDGRAVAYNGVILEPDGQHWAVGDTSYPEYKFMVTSLTDALELTGRICRMLDMLRMAPHEALDYIESAEGDTVTI